MRKNSPSLVPPQPAYGTTVYIVLDDFGPKLGRAYCETDEAEADEKTIIENMISVQYSNPVREWSPSMPKRARREMCRKT
jgi:hypothetical protein